MKVIYNNCYGAFDFSTKAEKMICNLKRLNYEYVERNMRNYLFDVSKHPSLREDKDAIYAIEHLGKEASANLSELKIAKIPNDWHYVIVEYDGLEKLLISKSEIHFYKDNKSN